jgi:hypothetical protein
MTGAFLVLTVTSLLLHRPPKQQGLFNEHQTFPPTSQRQELSAPRQLFGLSDNQAVDSTLDYSFLIKAKFHPNMKVWGFVIPEIIFLVRQSCTKICYPIAKTLLQYLSHKIHLNIWIK